MGSDMTHPNRKIYDIVRIIGIIFILKLNVILSELILHEADRDKQHIIDQRIKSVKKCLAGVCQSHRLLIDESDPHISQLFLFL